LDGVIKELSNSNIMALTINSMKYLQKDHFAIAISFLSRLVWNNEEDK
jgi:fused-like protein